MSLSITGMPDCCWRYMRGLNKEKVTFENFQFTLLRAFKNSGCSGTDWKPPTSTTGAILFCGAHSGGAMVLGGGTVAKTNVEANVEKICTWIEEEELGDVVELPVFENYLHRSKIIPRMWIIDKKKFFQALDRWHKDSISGAYYRKQLRKTW
jgi:hypothetical protein